MITINNEIQNLINEYNTCDKINHFFYCNKGTEEEVEKIIGHRFDRFAFVNQKFRIEKELMDWEKTFKGCTFKTPDGLIGKIKLSKHGVPFRKSGDSELPAFFIVVEGDQFNSHLYTIDVLEVLILKEEKIISLI